MRLFADGIRSLWDIGSCGNDVIVLYCKEFHKVHVSSGSKASEYLTPEKVATLQTTFQTYISTHGTQGFVLGLENLLKSLKFTLKGITPAFILLMGNMAVLGVMTVVLFYYILGKRFETNIWEDDNCYWVWELFVKCSTGILWLEICVLVMAKISHSSRALFYVFLAAVLGLIFCTALHYVSRRIYYHE
ncbi:hypothetical protein DPMN_008052 [Dreissena polymorpha]|uniref:Uncharacterized protein n=2 Tax=Dreissena polymorpha TaxID=45954 RepID=A0A9D4MXM7_DREPO|nr:hypothetical protein DPMN_008052 [Dreissena polymorpha]